MIIPQMPSVPIGMDEKAKEFLESLEDRINCIQVVKIDEDFIYVLGFSCDGSNRERYHEIAKHKASGRVIETSFKDPDIFSLTAARFFSFGLYNLSPNMKQVRKDKEDHDDKVRQYRVANLKEIEEKINGIKCYQGTIDEVQNELGVQLRMVDTGKPETFLQERDSFWLRVKAYSLGADAIVHYEHNTVIGTPVKFVHEH